MAVREEVVEVGGEEVEKGEFVGVSCRNRPA